MSAVILAAPIAFGAERAFVPGEVMVKYREGSRAGQAIKEAGKTTDRQGVTTFVEDLGSEATLPLMLKQLLSGGWILVAIDCNEVLKEVTERLRKLDNISEVVTPTSEPGGCDATSGLKVGFLPGSAEYEALRTTDEKSSSSPRLLSELEETVKVPLQVESIAEGELVLKLNISKMTIQLAERLERVHDVESAQVNYVMRLK